MAERKAGQGDAKRGRRAAAPRRRAATSIEKPLLDAIDSLTEGFALFDADDRLVISNERYREMYSEIAEEIRSGVTFEHLLRAMTHSPSSAVPPEQAEAHIAQRMAFHRSPGGALDVRRRNGRWIRVIDRRTADGWTVAIRVDITDLKRREGILSVVNEAAGRLLPGTGWRDQVQEMLAKLGPAAGVSRVTFSRNEIVDGVYEQDDLFEWTAPGVRRAIDDPALRNFPAKDTAFQDWRARRARGEVIHSLTRDLPDDKRAWFEMQDVKSAIRVPVMVDGRWWGTIGVDHTTEERIWQPHEIDALRAAAGLIGLAIQRDRAELERRRMDRLLFDALGALPQGIAVYDRERRLQLCNPAFADLYGMRPEDMIGMSAEAIIRRSAPNTVAVDGVPVWNAEEFARRRLAQFGKPSEEPMEIEWRDGRWFMVSDHPTAEGGVVFVRTDITEQKRVQSTLRDNEAFKSAMINASLDPIITTSDRGEILEFNNAAERTFLYRRDDVIGRSAVDVLVPPHLRSMRDHGIVGLRFAPEQGLLGRRVEAEAMRADGSTFMAELAVADSVLQGQRVFTTYLRDISDRQRMERALRDSEQRFRSIAEAHPVPVVIVRLADGMVVYASPSARTLFGIADYLGVRAIDFYADAADRGRIMAMIEKNGSVENVETQLRRADGATFPAALTSRQILWEGQPAIVTGVLDLTEAKKASAEIARQREALAHSEKLTALGSLLAGVAHELNNPLSVVVGQAAMLQELCGDAALSGRAEKIRRAAERCARIVKTFLAMARRRPPEVSAIDLNAVIEASIDLVAYSLRTTDVTLELELGTNLPRIMADADQINQVITNLMVNAQQALVDRPVPRRLAISTRFDAAREEIVLTVADNGPGVPPDLRQRIFEPFFTTKPTGVGTGVGLSMCQGVVESHGGRVMLQDTPGGGATFVVTFPARRAAATESPAPETAAMRKSRSGRILVVDDEPEMAQMLAEILQRVGHEVETAGDGQEALERLARQSYDLVLSDLRMPNLDGPGLYNAVAEKHPDQLRRLMFITGDTLAPHVTAFLAQTPVNFIEKPLNPRAVQEAVERALANGA
ncbi:MAG TPA: PAS-domain containing protein [Alphaproteobacteria bacterium]|nr:PAS-domain containing protein [Alphaproteobacteria bacterium]